jgi:hypothetical protein
MATQAGPHIRRDLSAEAGNVALAHRTLSDR